MQIVAPSLSDTDRPVSGLDIFSPMNSLLLFIE